MPAKTHIMHGRDHETHGADPIRGLLPAVGGDYEGRPGHHRPVSATGDSAKPPDPGRIPAGSPGRRPDRRITHRRA